MDNRWVFESFFNSVKYVGACIFTQFASRNMAAHFYCDMAYYNAVRMPLKFENS